MRFMPFFFCTLLFTCSSDPIFCFSVLLPIVPPEKGNNFLFRYHFYKVNPPIRVSLSIVECRPTHIDGTLTDNELSVCAGFPVVLHPEKTSSCALPIPACAGMPFLCAP